MTTARQENARTLAAAIGVTEGEADTLLDAAVLITSGPEAKRLAGYIEAMLARTLTHVLREPDALTPAVLEIVVGAAAPRTSTRTVGVGVDGYKLEVCDGRTTFGGTSHPIVELVVACYAAAAAVHRALNVDLPVPLRMPIGVDLAQLYGDDIRFLTQRIEIGTSVMAGAGAIGNAVALGFSALDVHGELHICDPDDASDGNLNRCWWFSAEDLAQPKAERLVFRAQRSMPGLLLVPHVKTLREFVKATGETKVETMIVAVDSRRARRGLQTEMPRRVFDASTTGITEVVLHFNTLPSEDACMSCIYYEAANETAHEAHVAESLGVDIVAVKANFVSPEAAQMIASKYPQLDPKLLEGLAYDSLFKELCGKGQLKNRSAERVLAPFAFVSVLAGVMLAIEIAVRTGAAARTATYNYWRLSPWGAPNGRMRERRPQRLGCEFCGNQVLLSVVKSLWG